MRVFVDLIITELPWLLFISFVAFHFTMSGIGEFTQVIQKAIDNREVIVNERVELLDFENASGKKFDEELENITTITVPFKNNSSSKVESFSGLTVSFDSNLNIQQYGEIQLVETDDRITSRVYTNGELAGSTVVNKTRNGERVQPTDYLDDVQECLVDFGITPDSAQAIISTCGLVCTITLGTGCIACLGVFGSIGMGIIIGCFTSQA